MTDKTQKQTNKKKRKKSGTPTESPVKIQKTGGTTVMEVTDQSIAGLPQAPIIVTPPIYTKPDVQVQLKTEDRPVPKPEKGSLGSLLMETGAVDKLLTEKENTWPRVAKGLKDVFLKYQQTLPTKADPTPPSEYTADLCTIYYSAKAGRKTADGPDAEFCKGNEVNDTVGFLETFMRANGQWDYIEKQDWYTSGDYVIGIDVNYYPDRSGYKESPVFHKDTGGNNLFVNLVFDNPKPIEKTEWFADLEQPSKKRTAWQKGLLPDDVLKDLDSSRTVLALQPEYTKDKPVNGGVTEGVNAYVSWVDDLVWHATPNNLPRITYGTKTAETTYAAMDNAAKGDGFFYKSPRFKRNILGVEILGTMAEAGDTELARWLKRQVPSLGPQDIDVEVAKKAWQELYNSKKQGGRDTFLKDVAIREKAAEWRITGEYSEASAQDKRLPASTSLQETPLSLSTRRRANSLTPQSVEAVRKANEKVERSFLRTWVRILPKTSAEARKSGLV